MAFEDEGRKFGRELIRVVEIDQKGCSRTHGVAPCTATGTGDARCYNTLTTCQDVPNYNEETRTYRFCEPRSPHPIAIDAIPNVESVSITPAEINLSGGFGKGARATVNFVDHPHDDYGFDDYLSGRTFDPYEKGTLWTKFRARNKFYEHEEMRILTGFIVNGEFDERNFETRHFVIQDLNATKGGATIHGGDILSRITEKKPLAPKPSTGTLLAGITAGAVSMTLTPAGVYTEYPSGSKVRINGEVMTISHAGSDTMTITRAQNNTTAAAHNAGDTVQLCLEYTPQQVNAILADLLITYGNVPASFINTDQWQREADAALTTNASGIITSPVEVNKLVKELGEQFPHSLFWDDRLNKIVMRALKEPPTSAPEYNEDENILADSFETRDRRDLQISTVYVRFGQVDPTKNLDEPSNFSQTYVRVNADAISRYKSNNTKVVNSRWIPGSAKSAAIKLATTIGRRFGFSLREINFNLDFKDPFLNIGSIARLLHRDILDFSGDPDFLKVKITGASEKDRYNYKALEYIYDDELPDDLGSTSGQTLVYIGLENSKYDINLRGLFNVQEAVPPDASTNALFILESGFVAALATSGTAIDTGSWPAGATITLRIDEGAVVAGKGGEAGEYATNLNGGTAIILNHDLTLINNGIIGGGGGGGETTYYSTYNFKAGGGGGGGFGVSFSIYGEGQNTNLNGSSGGLIKGGSPGGFYASAGGSGGDLGQAGNNPPYPVGGVAITGPGTAGAAIDRNGYTLTQTVAGDIRGAILV